LDIPFTFPNVTTIEYQQFRKNYYPNGQTNISHWVMEANYTHGDTIFSFQQPAQHNKMSTQEEIRQRDISTIGEEGAPRQLWTFLDTFYSHIHPSISARSTFNLRYSELIRNTAKTIQKEVFNNTPYSSIHLRVGGHGHFKDEANNRMQDIIKQHQEQLQNWIIQRLAWNQTIPSSLGVFVATDSESQKESFAAQLSAALGDLQSKYNFFTQIHYSSSFQEYSKALEQSLVYPDIFLDQQIAASAPVVFTPSKGSSFSLVIGWLRKTCDFSSVQ
jgi:GDP-fucose protein O-fucosyltransferase